MGKSYAASKSDLGVLRKFANWSNSFQVFEDERYEIGFLPNISLNHLMIAEGFFTGKAPPPGYYSTEALKEQGKYVVEDKPFFDQPFIIDPNIASDELTKFSISAEIWKEAQGSFVSHLGDGSALKNLFIVPVDEHASTYIDGHGVEMQYRGFYKDSHGNEHSMDAVPFVSSWSPPAFTIFPKSSVNVGKAFRLRTRFFRAMPTEDYTVTTLANHTMVFESVEHGFVIYLRGWMHEDHHEMKPLRTSEDDWIVGGTKSLMARFDKVHGHQEKIKITEVSALSGKQKLKSPRRRSPSRSEQKGYVNPDQAYENFMNSPSVQPNYYDPLTDLLESEADAVIASLNGGITSKVHTREQFKIVPDQGAVEQPDWVNHWKGMPDFKNEKGLPFDEQSDVDDEDDGIDEEAKNKVKIKNQLLRWMDDSRTLPRYPVYIISKSRAQYMKTSKSLAKIRIPHYIAVEPQQEAEYKEALTFFGLSEYATLLILPFSDHGEGPSLARNWCWDHSIRNGFARHWVLDDNINDFYRLHNNVRVRVDSGAIFRAAEDFVDRYDNLPLASFGYRHDYAPKSKWAPIRLNSRNYSMCLIENSCPYRWEGRYNEDTILSLRILQHKEPKLCTLEFCTFLQGKEATQTSTGGNTDEFYWEGTFKKSKFLYDQQPVDSRVWFEHNRWHHKVDYSIYTQRLRLKDGVEVPEGINNYGMYFISNFTKPDHLPW
ncbi:hypothetical protein [Leisingera sp. JC11]|uniref:GREB1-related protein n=1 Tax=Leisingera sp. JC11 TaxID=3042469 RepID=UPI0034540DCD